ncbi:hypothetical protein Tco_1500310 [Tanacetum coccineum]
MLLLNQKCMSYLVRAYYSISPTRYYKDDLCWSADLKSNTTEDVIRDLGEIEEVNANYILMANLQQTSTWVLRMTTLSSMTQMDQQKYTILTIVMIMIYSISLLKRSISSVEQSGRIVEQNPGTIKETRAYFESLYNNLAIEIEFLKLCLRDLDKIEEVNANCILMANLQQALTLGTQTDKAPVYDSDRLDEVHEYDNCYNNDIFNMFTQTEQYTELLEPIPEPHQVQQNDSNVISAVSSVEQSGGTVEQHSATVEETPAKFVRDFKSLAKEADESLAKHKALELEIERLLRAVVSQDIIL